MITNDTEAIDAIATALGTAESWDADTLDTIAEVIGLVRPHPGSGRHFPDYAGYFEAATGRPVPERYRADW